MTIHLPKVNQFGGGAGGGGNASFPTIVTDSGSSLPATTGYQEGDTFLNTSDKKIYKAEADTYELNTNARIFTITTTPLTIDYRSGVANGFTFYYQNSNYYVTCLLKERLSSDFAWTGEKEYKIHFKRNSTGNTGIRYLLFATASEIEYSLTKYIGVQIINSKLYISEFSGSSEAVAPFMLVDYELEANKEYYVKLLKKSNGKIETTIYENGYDQTMLATNIVDNQIEDVTPRTTTATVLWCGAFWRGTDDSLGIGFNGDIYLLDTTGDFLKPSLSLSWDNGTNLTDKTEYADKTNGILYLYENSELNAIPNLEDYKKKAETITIDTASVTIANVQANKNYVLSSSALTGITLTACETSFEETSINFTTGSSAPTFTDNASIKWFGGVPEMKANTTYTIVIFNKQAYWQEQENV